MGRKRIDESEKKQRVSISLKRKYVEQLKEYHPENMSKKVEELVKDYLKKK